MITQAIVFDHRGRTKPNSEGPVEVRVTVDRKLYHINTGVRVKKKELRDGRVINRGDANVLNDRLTIISNRIAAAVNKRIEKNIPIDVAQIKKQAYSSSYANNKTSMYEWIESQIPMLPIKEGTKKRYYVLLSRLKSFGELMSWDDLNVDMLYQWDAWLHTLTVSQSNGEVQAGEEPEYISDAAVYNYHKTLKAMLRRAVVSGKIEANPYDKLRGVFKRGDRESVDFLTEDEIAAIESLKPVEGTQMAMARDLFIFQLYTGLSYADTQAFDIANYKKIDGKWLAVAKRIKTGVPYVSQLLPQAVEVLENYGMQVPKINNQQYNESLKVMQQACGVSTNLHSHLARHTFATRALAMGVKIENVSKMLGHTNITQTQRYAKVLAESVHEDFDKMAEKLRKK